MGYEPDEKYERKAGKKREVVRGAARYRAKWQPQDEEANAPEEPIIDNFATAARVQYLVRSLSSQSQSSGGNGMQGSASGSGNRRGRGGDTGRGIYEQRGSRRGRGDFSSLNTAMANTALQSSSSGQPDQFSGSNSRGGGQRGRGRRGGRASPH